MINRLPQDLLPRIFDALSYRDCANFAQAYRACSKTFKDHPKRGRGMARKQHLRRFVVCDDGEAPMDPGDVTLQATLGPVVYGWEAIAHPLSSLGYAHKSFVL